MASGFWAMPMTHKPEHISAFVISSGTECLSGKNAPLIYQQMLDNCRWGFVRLPLEEEVKVDTEVLEFLAIKAENKVERQEFFST
ncbi:hypothetical protein PHMEG_00012281 [Phytophthora megakarya]|uniref:Uncharacterized protein n=1 Tax=Phytophthora megakarya TaxID=4795 RepID=A0A225WBQ7_9STRA|nr:hypothetical protein PHMEG_00012281 [Phytophthora megakarya]